MLVLTRILNGTGFSASSCINLFKTYIAHPWKHSENQTAASVTLQGDVSWRFVHSAACAVYFCLTVVLCLLLKSWNGYLCSVCWITVTSWPWITRLSCPACYHLNHMLIPPPCTQRCWINNGISVKQLLLASCSVLSHLLSLSFSVSPPHLHICCPHIRTLQWLPFISWGLIHYDRVVSFNLPNLPQYKLKTKQHVLVQQWIINHAKTRFNWFLPPHFPPSIAQNKYLTSWLQYTSGLHLQLIVGLDWCPITFPP